MNAIYFVILVIAIGALLTSPGFSDVSAAKNDNNGKALGCEKASEKSKGIGKNPHCDDTPPPPPLECPPGQHEENGVCVDDVPPPLECPPGQHDDVPPPLECPPGQHEENGVCVDDVPPPLECPPGQHEENGVCVDDVPPPEQFTLCDDNPIDGQISLSELVAATGNTGLDQTSLNNLESIAGDTNSDGFINTPGELQVIINIFNVCLL